MSDAPKAPSLATHWFHLELALGSAVQRTKHGAPFAKIDWGTTDHYVSIGALAVACAVLEDAGLRNKNEHVKLLFEIRNALIHNAGNLALNRKPTALADAQTYLQTKGHLRLSPELTQPFFSLKGSVVKLEPGMYFAVRLCML
jgi:hypothetical protein